MPTIDHEVDLSFAHLDQIMEDRLSAGSGINLKLPDGGFLYMDRPLPFMMVYRYANKDPFIESLINAEAAGLVIHEKYYDQAKAILQYLSENLSGRFGAFLIIELWPDESDNTGFKIFNNEKKSPSTFHFLKEKLEELNGARPFSVEVISAIKRGPERLEPLFTTQELKNNECLLIALEIPAFYKDPSSGNIYPILARDLRSRLSKAFQQTFFEFIKVQTDHTAKSFQALGRRNIQKEVWEIDARLAEISRAYDFLLLVSPINGREAWQKFKGNGYRKTPHFQYRMIPVDPESYKKKLYDIPIEKIEDPTLAYLFRDKRGEIDKMLTMLESRNTEQFMYGSLQVYGGVKKELINIARGFLTVFPFENAEEEDHENGDRTIDRNEFISLAKQEFAYLKSQLPEVEISVKEKDDVMGLMVSRGSLIVGGDVREYSEKRAMALIQHEVGTHVLTYYNGKSQPLKLLYTGAPGYEELQEGLAVLSEYLSGGLTKKRLQILSARVIAINAMIKGYDFVNTFQLLIDEYNLDEYTAFTITTRVFRGGGLTKDAVYLRGFIHLLEYIKEGRDLHGLLIGKIRQDYISIIRELISRNILKPIPIAPRYLREPAYLEKLKSITGNTSIFNLI